ncbi:MAG: hypothetical protein MI702_09110, partial [Chlorobiales bacterium]|nr:hypothetical protein [Chlorobiales bacterium]
MNSTIDSTFQIRIDEEASIMSTLDRFKQTQDIPWSDLQYRKKADSLFELTVKYPISVFDGSVTQMMAVLYGEMPFMNGFGKLKFVRLSLPEEAFQWFKGPRFGVRGIRERWGMKTFPFLMGIIKPSIDFASSPVHHALKIEGPLKGGFHAVKDDEIAGSFAHLSLEQRMALSKKYPGYIPVINADDIDTIKRLIDKWNPKMFMVNASIMGFPQIKIVADFSTAPILSHLALQGTFAGTFSPWLYAFLHRLFGCDAFITAIGERGYYAADKGTEHDAVDALLCRLPIKRTMPLLAGGARIHNLDEICKPYISRNLP